MGKKEQSPPPIYVETDDGIGGVFITNGEPVGPCVPATLGLELCYGEEDPVALVGIKIAGWIARPVARVMFDSVRAHLAGKTIPQDQVVTVAPEGSGLLNNQPLPLVEYRLPDSLLIAAGPGYRQGQELAKGVWGLEAQEAPHWPYGVYILRRTGELLNAVIAAEIFKAQREHMGRMLGGELVGAE